MNIEPLASAAAPIPLHAYSALLAIAAGAVQLAGRKGTLLHRLSGYAWIALMLVVAISGFFIHSFKVFGPFSPVHALSIITIVAVVWAACCARAGNIRRHKRLMLILFWGALVVTGLFTLLPGRIMHAVVFG